MSTRRDWTRAELVVAFNLYCKIPFGRIHNRNPEIIALARQIGRTPSALSWKLANFARLDPSVRGRNRSGATHGAASEQEVWDEFHGNWNELAYESERLLVRFGAKESLPKIEHLPRGSTRLSLIKARVNQGFFRSAVLASYDQCCCITGLDVPSLLNASHIVPWRVDEDNRTNPSNGLCLNALHDRAFDSGLITVPRIMWFEFLGN
jgi:HNH endonuclease